MSLIRKLVSKIGYKISKSTKFAIKVAEVSWLNDLEVFIRYYKSINIFINETSQTLEHVYISYIFFHFLQLPRAAEANCSTCSIVDSPRLKTEAARVKLLLKVNAMPLPFLN